MEQSVKIKDVIIKWRMPFNCTLMESIMTSEVETALTDWIKNTKTDDYLLIGGAVVGYYTKPRMTQDVDVLYKSSDLIPNQVNGFKHHRDHAFEHQETGVEVETLDSQFIGIPQELVEQVFSYSEIVDGVRIPSPSGLVALKVCRHNFQDIADIHSVAQNHDIDLTGWKLDPSKLHLVEQRLGYTLRSNK
jgi:hypothetical protein